jgi:predicted MFS family arabinose efflux permease
MSGQALLVSADSLSRARWALLFGNFVIGCGVFVVAGTLNDISRSLQVSVPLAGQLISIGGAVMCFGAPLLAGWVAGFDRHRLLAWTMLWYAAGHALCALMPSYATLWPLRAATVLGAAVFTPQAAAAMGFMAPPEQRGRAITFIFLGWSVASVLGMPFTAWLGEVHGWRMAFGAVAALSVLAALGVFASLPDGVKPAALSLRAWKEVFTHPVLMLIVLVTALQSAGQFTVFSYMAPYYRQVLQASPAQITLMFAWFGVFGLVGNLLLTRYIDRIGANRAVAVATGLIALSLLLWPLAVGVASMLLVTIPWALGCFSANSGQQARLNAAGPALASALMALNSSAMYLGQALGASGGGWLIAHAGYAPLSWVGLLCLLAALALSMWVARRSMKLSA